MPFSLLPLTLAMLLPRHAQAQIPAHTKLVAPPALHIKAPKPHLTVPLSLLPPPEGPPPFGGGMSSFAPASTPWQPVGPAPLNGGQSYSGRIAGMAADLYSPGVYYVAAAGGGVWKTSDAGLTWTPLTDGQPVDAMGAIAVATHNDSVIFAGTGEANNSGDSEYGWGILYSTNDGATWTDELGPGNAFVGLSCSRIAAADANFALAAMGDLAVNGYFGNAGVYKTGDGGTTWTNTTSSITTTASASDVLIDPFNNTVCYCAIGASYGDPANGVYVSTDQATTWAPAGNFPMGASDGRIALAMAASNPQELFALVCNPANNQFLEMLKTTDGGTNWSVVSGIPASFMQAGGQAWYDTTIAINPTNPNVIYAGGSANYGSSNIIQSTDGGSTWTDISTGNNGVTPHSDMHAMTFDANGRLLIGNDGGIWRLDSASPGNIAWTDINSNLQTLQFTGASIHPTNADYALGGSQDNGTEELNGLFSWDEFIGGDGGWTAINQSTPSTQYGEFTGISLYATTNSWSSAGYVYPSGAPGEPSNFYIHYVMDPANSSRILLPTDHLWETTDGGATWNAIGTPGVAGFNTSDLVVDCVGVAGSVIYAAVGGEYSNSSQIYVTTNDGASWTQAASAPGSAHVADLIVDPSSPSLAFGVGDRFGNSLFFYTNDGGSTWNDASSGLPGDPANALAANWSPLTIYVGTDNQVFATSSPGVWTQVGSGLPDARVVGLAINLSTGVLAAATHGRGLWEIPLATANPLISSLSPASKPANSASFKLTVAGAGFVKGASVYWDGAALKTTFVSASTLTAVVPVADLTTPHVAAVTVANAGGPQSMVFPFQVQTPLPVLKSLSPSSALAGGNTFTLILKGTGFLPATVVSFNPGFLGQIPTYVSSTELKAIVYNSEIASAGTATVSVINPGPGGGTTSKTFPILLTALSLKATSSVRNGDGSVTVNFSLKNIGHNAAASTQVSTAKLGTKATSTTLPYSLGNIAAGASASGSLTFPNPGAAGTSAKLALTGTFSGGSYSLSATIKLP